MASTFKLKLLSGPLSGREIHLPVGTFRIGGELADLAVTLEGGASTTLVVDNTHIRLDAPLPCWIDGQPAPTDGALPLGCAIDLAGFGFALGAADDVIDITHIPPRVSATAASATPSPSSTPNDAPQRLRRLLPMALSLALGIIALITVGVLYGMSPKKASPPNLQQQLNALVTQLNTPTLGVVLEGESMVRLRGDCSQRHALQSLRASIRELGLSILDDTLCANTSLDDVRTILRMHGYRDVTVSMPETGTVVDISGPILADARWQRTTQALDALSLPGGWRVRNDTGPQLTMLSDWLAKHHQLSGLGIARQGSTWTVTGQLTIERQAAIQSLLAEYNENLADNMQARFVSLPNRAPSTAESLLSSPVVSLGGHRQTPYATLADGTRLAVGAILPGGARVVAIGMEGVSLLTSERIIHIPLAL